MKLRLNSLYICVRDMKRALAFYEAFLGQKADTEDEIFSVFDIGGFRYCLFQPDRVNETVRWGDSCLPSFETDDMEGTVSRITELGRPIVFPLKQIGRNMVFEFTDTEGNDIEVFSPAGTAGETDGPGIGRKDCPCKRTKCERHGKCAECIEHHRTKRYPPACERANKKSK